MSRPIIVDTGPLVAFLNTRDHHHDWVREEWGNLTPPLMTCEAVLSEACFLVKDIVGGAEAVVELVSRRIVTPTFRMDSEAVNVMRLMRRYDNVPMAFADACLVRLSEQHAGSVIMTVDSDFLIYRRHRREVIPTIMPPPASPRPRRRRVP